MNDKNTAKSEAASQLNKSLAQKNILNIDKIIYKTINIKQFLNVDMFRKRFREKIF